MVIGYWVLTVLVAAGVTNAQRVEDDVRRLAESFPVVDAANNLFDAGNGYVLRLIHERGLTIEFQLAPKHYFQSLHPEWTEPDRYADLSAAAYASILARIDKVNPVGKLLTKGQFVLTTNSRSPFVDVHTLAVVQRANGSSLLAGESGQVVSARIAYFRSILGKVEDVSSAANPGFTPTFDEYRVRIDGRWYWVTQATFKTLSVGTVQTVQAAGPVDTRF